MASRPVVLARSVKALAETRIVRPYGPRVLYGLASSLLRWGTGLAGGYAALLLGAPWWFLDSPEVLRRFRETVTESAGFYNTAGFVDDTRAFCSIPVRHDVARRVDAGFLARLVAEHRDGAGEAATRGLRGAVPAGAVPFACAGGMRSQ